MIREPDRIIQSIKPGLLRCIFLVESDQDSARTIAHLLSVQKSYHIFVIKGCSETLEVTQHMKPDLFIINEHLWDGSGSALYEQLQQRKALLGIPVIIIDGEQLIFPYVGTPEQKITVTAPRKLLLHCVADLMTSYMLY